MIRVLIYILLSIFLITILRMVIGIVMQGLNAYLNPASKTTARSGGSSAGRRSGVLRKDSFTGVYIAEDAAITKVINGETHYFASEDNFRSYLDSRSARA
jgi:YHS domain-containing protein